MRNAIVAFLVVIVLYGAARADQAITGANSDPTYRQLRDISLGGDAVAIANLTLRRDAGTFKFKSGTFVFAAPVNGKITGAVFTGEGEFVLTPPIASEARMVSLLTKQNGNEVVETFHKAVLRFTDSTYEEIRKAGTPAQGSVGNIHALRASGTTRVSRSAIRSISRKCGRNTCFPTCISQTPR